MNNRWITQRDHQEPPGARPWYAPGVAVASGTTSDVRSNSS